MEINIKFNESDIEKMKKLKYLDLNVNDEKELKKWYNFIYLQWIIYLW